MSSKNLVIVESPAKAKTIQKFLGPSFEIKASFGHVRDLPDKKLGIDIKKEFQPTYTPLKDKTKVLKEIQTAAKKAATIYIATDPDREGEAIAWHIKESASLPDSKVQRIVFNEITESAVQNAVQQGRDIDMHLVDAQQARRILDRLIGYKLSPILSKKIRRGLSAGRVQSVAVKIICDREKEILSFIPQEYWTIDTELTVTAKSKLVTRLFAKETEKAKFQATTEAEATEVVSHLKKAEFNVQSLQKRPITRHPQPPFITSSLQQEASRKLNWSAKKTMMVAQQLYEGVELGGESVGLITYMRTDSIRISDDAKAAAKDLIIQHFGEKYLSPKKAEKKQGSRVQDAHEAIRPSYCDKIPKALKSSLSADHYKLYSLIWDRFIASQMAPALLESTSIIVRATQKNQPDYFLKATGSIITFDGFTKLYSESQDHPDQEENLSILPKVEEGQQLPLKTIDHQQKFTQPPARYTEASLVKELEERGIGRPSTYAPTLSVIQDRGYISKEKKTLFPSELGLLVNERLEGFFQPIIDPTFTAKMETQLDDITEGKHRWQDIIQEFYTPFSGLLDKANQDMVKVDNTKPSDEICDKCSSPMIIRDGRFGEFLACSNFPDCKNTKSIAKPVEAICPLCHSALQERRSKKGKVFYGCTTYPKCTFATWDMPLPDTCPTCNQKTMFKKSWKGKESVTCATCNPKAPE
jgi:DNA topoisomerase-1